MKRTKKLKIIAAMFISCNTLAYGGTTPIDAADADKCPQPSSSDNDEYNDLCETFFTACHTPNWAFVAGAVIDYPIQVIDMAQDKFFLAKDDFKRCTGPGGSTGSGTLSTSASFTEGSSWDATGSVTAGAEGSWLGLAKASIEVEIGGRYGQSEQTQETETVSQNVAPAACKHAYSWVGGHFMMGGKAQLPASVFCTFRGQACGHCSQSGFLVNLDDSQDIEIGYENMEDDGSMSSLRIKRELTEITADCSYPDCDCDSNAGGTAPSDPDWYTTGEWDE